MRDKRARIDISGEAEPLTSNPFAALAGAAAIAAAAPSLAPAPEVTGTTVATPGFRVARTRKGGYPVSFEKRSAGKVVTVVREVSGDAEALLSLLKRHCAAGGKAFDGYVEIQGDHRAKVEAILRELGCR